MSDRMSVADQIELAKKVFNTSDENEAKDLALKAYDYYMKVNQDFRGDIQLKELKKQVQNAIDSLGENMRVNKITIDQDGDLQLELGQFIKGVTVG